MGLIAILVGALMLWAVSLWLYPAETITAFLVLALGASFYVWGLKR